MSNLKEKIAIVTGGSGGIGSAVCLKLAQLGAKVVVHYGGSEGAAKDIVSKIEVNGGKAIALQANLSKSVEVTKLFEQTEQQLGQPDIVVTFAGTGDVGKLIDMDESAFDKVFGLNTKGTFFCLQEAAKRIKDNGRIVTVSSGLVVRPQPGFGLYISSKAAVESMSKVLSLELGDRNITVNTVAPGPTETEMYVNSGDDADAAAAQSPFNRIGQPEDIADVVGFVVSDECRWITGHVFEVGGGYV
ncbi:SDR family oxidoreductase [Pleurocapsa sp. PCC 7319]|uniref:SDR family oxidoreductase n=1 Tax=Pleurocapsa sp. PCC 7319 TaxID=118161 RepID=UPI000344DDDC|nr:SDR family oxidoreductase [Pleurocapsa sp. PCC 7319]